MRKKQKKVAPVAQRVEINVDAREFSNAEAHLCAACTNLYNLYMLAKAKGNEEEESYYYYRFLNVDQVLWSLRNH